MTRLRLKVSIRRGSVTWSLTAISNEMSFLQAVVALAVCERHPLLFRRFVLLPASCRYVPHPSADRTLHLVVVQTCGLLRFCSGGCLLAQLRQPGAKLLGFRFQRINLLLRLFVDAGSRFLHLRDPLLQRFQLRVGKITSRSPDSLTRRLGVLPDLRVSRRSTEGFFA